MSPAKQATPKYHARAAVGRRANTLRLVLRKLCGDVKVEAQPLDQSNQGQAQQLPAAEAAPGNVAPWPENPENLLIRRMSESLDRHEVRTGGSLRNACPGPAQVCALSRHQKPLNPFEDSSLDSSPGHTPHGAPDQPNEHGSSDYNPGGILNQPRVQHPQAVYRPPLPSTSSGFEETNTTSARAADPIDCLDLSPYISSDFIPTPATHPTTALLTESQKASSQAHPPMTATTVTTAAPSPPYIARPTNDNHNHNPSENHNHNPNDSHNPNHNHHNYHNNPNNTPPPHGAPFTALQYTSMRLALITDSVQLTPSGTAVRVNNRREALRRTPEALVPV